MQYLCWIYIIHNQIFGIFSNRIFSYRSSPVAGFMMYLYWIYNIHARNQVTGYCWNIINPSKRLIYAVFILDLPCPQLDFRYIFYPHYWLYPKPCSRKKVLNRYFWNSLSPVKRLDLCCVYNSLFPNQVTRYCWNIYTGFAMYTTQFQEYFLSALLDISQALQLEESS